jgi:hypothetical protein
MASTRNLRHGQLKIIDGSGTPNTLIIPIAAGDLNFTVHSPSFTIRNRGVIDHSRAGDEKEMDISFSFLFEQWQANAGNTGISVVDALTQSGLASTWMNVDPSCGPFRVNLEFKIVDPCNNANYETLLFPKFHAESLNFREGNDANSISVSGMCLAVKPTRTYTP